jgi:hypothetical protein
MIIAELTRALQNAKDHYIRALRQIDTRLHAAVRTDPNLLKESQDLQKTYGVVFTPWVLSAMEQPPDPVDVGTRDAPDDTRGDAGRAEHAKVGTDEDDSTPEIEDDSTPEKRASRAVAHDTRTPRGRR